MRLFSIIKRNSRLALRGNWGRAIILLLLMMGAGMVLSGLQQGAMMIFVPAASATPPPGPEASPQDLLGYLSGAVSLAEWIIISLHTLLTILLVTPVALGAMRWFYNLVHGKRLPVSDAFYFFESGRRYGRAVWYEINISVRTLLWGLLFFTIPGCILFFSSWAWQYPNDEMTRTQTAVAGLGVLLGCILTLLACLFYSACTMRYSLAAFLLGEDDGLSVRKAIKQSVRYTRGYRFSLVWFGLSYIWWLILAAIILTVVATLPYSGVAAPLLQLFAGAVLFVLVMFGAFYYWPYYTAGLAMYARFIIEKKQAEAQATLEFSAQEDAAPAESPTVDPLENLLYDRSAADERTTPETEEAQTENASENPGDIPAVTDEAPAETAADAPVEEPPEAPWN